MLDKLDSLDVAKIIADAGRFGLINATGCHHGLVLWNIDQPEDDHTPTSFACKRLRKIKAVLDKACVSVNFSINTVHFHIDVKSVTVNPKGMTMDISAGGFKYVLKYDSSANRLAVETDDKAPSWKNFDQLLGSVK